MLICDENTRARVGRAGTSDKYIYVFLLEQLRVHLLRVCVLLLCDRVSCARSTGFDNIIINLLAANNTHVARAALTYARVPAAPLGVAMIYLGSMGRARSAVHLIRAAARHTHFNRHYTLNTMYDAYAHTHRTARQVCM